MKVLHITNNYPTANHPIFGIFVKEQIESLSAIGIENEIFFINGREEGRKAYLQGLKRLRKILLSNSYDLIHCHHAFSGIIFLLTLRFFGKRCLISYQNDPIREGGIGLFHLFRMFFNGIILKNKTEEIKFKNIYYLPNGVNTDFFIPMDNEKCKMKLGLNLKDNYILFMDSYKLRTQKRVDRFYSTIELLQSNGNPLNIEPLILTNTERSLMPYYINASKMHLLTSDFEGSPNSVKECLACNIPVVATPVGNIDDLLKNINGCAISKTFEPKELVSLVKNIMSFNGFSSREKLLEKELDIKSVAQKLASIYTIIANE